MLPHQQRVIDEKTALDEKIAKLTSFLSTQTFADLHPIDKAMLKRQLLVMTEYSQILFDRINRF